MPPVYEKLIESSPYFAIMAFFAFALLGIVKQVIHSQQKTMDGILNRLVEKIEELPNKFEKALNRRESRD